MFNVNRNSVWFINISRKPKSNTCQLIHTDTGLPYHAVNFIYKTLHDHFSICIILKVDFFRTDNFSGCICYCKSGRMDSKLQIHTYCITGFCIDQYQIRRSSTRTLDLSFLDDIIILLQLLDHLKNSRPADHRSAYDLFYR